MRRQLPPRLALLRRFRRAVNLRDDSVGRRAEALLRCIANAAYRGSIESVELKTVKADVAIVGGGLAGGLIAWRLRVVRPETRVIVIERGETLGGAHTWSFHETDMPEAIAKWMDEIVVHAWSSQEVRFPAHGRILQTGYRTTTSTSLHRVVAPMLGSDLILNAEAVEVAPERLVLADGRDIDARAVIDARGQCAAPALTIGFQKFVGQVLNFSAPHGLTRPMIMDAAVPQNDGYRFVYVLPFSPDTALVEDTYYSDGATLDTDHIRHEIRQYCQRNGWMVDRVAQEEQGVLPIALAGDIDAHLAGLTPGVAQAGLRAGLFHPLTGYSLPDAAILAEAIADAPDLSGAALSAMTRAHAASRWRERAFYRLLSRFLYHAAAPQARYKVLARFYRLSEPLIERFYAGQSSTRDKARVLVGKPPVNFLRAFDCVDEARWRRKRSEMAALAS